MANENQDIARPFFIKVENQIVGFTMFAFDPSIPEKNFQYWLWQFMISKEFQGLGYARLSLSKIIDYFKSENADFITLSTKPSNHNAIRLYKEFGFEDTGELSEGEVVFQKKLNP